MQCAHICRFYNTFLPIYIYLKLINYKFFSIYFVIPNLSFVKDKFKQTTTTKKLLKMSGIQSWIQKLTKAEKTCINQDGMTNLIYLKYFILSPVPN